MKVSGSGLTIEQGDESLAELLESQLLISLRNDLQQSLNTDFTLSAKSTEGEVIGGLVASTSYSWLLVKVVWVAECQRGGGIGRSLMNAAEAKAKELDCHSVWLDTSNPSAKHFYSRLGYEIFGKLENSEEQFPAIHCRWFMKKAL